jgi:tetratricopeptide (TPR) repeat protein
MATRNVEAYGDLLHGREFLKKYTAADNAEARKYFESSLDHDPNYAPACAAMARSYNYDWQFSWGEDPENALDHALTWARKAVALDRSSARAHAELGFNLLFNKRVELAVKELRIATNLNPNDADIMAELSDALTYTNQLEEAVELLKTAMRLNPNYPDWYLWYLADAYYALRQYDEAIDALEGMTNPTIGARLLAASHAQLGNVEKAGMHAEQVLRDQPDFSVEEWMEKQPEINPAETEHFAEGLRKAGLPG